MDSLDLCLVLYLIINGNSQMNPVNYNIHSNSLKRKIRIIQVGKINMEYLLTGIENEETILFVHGLGANLSQFEKQHEYFQDRYTVLSICLRGHGNTSSSSELRELDFELSKIGNDIIMLLDTLGIGNVHYVGNSMGGNIGYELMKVHSDKMLSFTSYGTTAKLKKSDFTVGLMKFTYKLISMNTIGKLSGSAGVNEDSKTKIFGMMSQAQKSTVLNLVPHLGAFSYLEVIKNSKVWALIIRGDKDKEINKVLESTIEAFKERGYFNLIDLENTGHFANLDNPDIFNRTLEIFLTELGE